MKLLIETVSETFNIHVVRGIVPLINVYPQLEAQSLNNFSLN